MMNTRGLLFQMVVQLTRIADALEEKQAEPEQPYENQLSSQITSHKFEPRTDAPMTCHMCQNYKGLHRYI